MFRNNGGGWNSEAPGGDVLRTPVSGWQWGGAEKRSAVLQSWPERRQPGSGGKEGVGMQPFYRVCPWNEALVLRRAPRKRGVEGAF